jgi:UDP-N-acetylmuramate dehydrogenase
MPTTRLNLQEDVPLAPLTTLKVGGPARFFVAAKSVEEIASAVEFARTSKLPLFVLGGGSNLVVADRGWPGVVVKVEIAGLDRQETSGKAFFDAGAGEDWDHFVAQAVKSDCAGIECLSGIPGTVGGTPVQNVGAYGQEVSQTIESVSVFDIAENVVREMKAAECGFSYRSSIFNTSQRGRYVILRVRFGLIPGGKPGLGYADLQRHFAGRESQPTLSEVRDTVRSIRGSKGMLIVSGEAESRSAGSFFKNPVLAAEQYEALLRRADDRGVEVPSYPALSQQHKVSAAWLVENSGFSKGYAKGKAGISSKHALAIVNRGGATAEEIVALKDEIQAGVKHTWGIELTPEPVMVGF